MIYAVTPPHFFKFLPCRPAYEGYTPNQREHLGDGRGSIIRLRGDAVGPMLALIPNALNGLLSLLKLRAVALSRCRAVA